jgi:hypothetical protein
VGEGVREIERRENKRGGKKGDKVKGEKREDDLNTSESNVRMRGEWISEGLCGRERERERWEKGMGKRQCLGGGGGGEGKGWR